MQQYELPPDEEIINIRQGFRALTARWKIAATAAAIIFTTGLFFTFIQKPVYRASALLLIEPEKDQSPFAELMPFSSGVPVATEMEVLKSRTLAEHVVRQIGLDVIPLERPEEAKVRVRNFALNGMDEDGTELRFRFQSPVTFTVYNSDGDLLSTGLVGRDFKFEGLSFRVDAENLKPGDEVVVRAVLFDDAVDALRENLKVSEIASQTNVVQVSADSPSPMLAAEIVNTLTKGYIAQILELKSREAGQTLDFVEKQLESIHTSLVQGEGELRQFKSERGIFLLSEQAEQIISQLGELEAGKTQLEVQSRQIDDLGRTLKNDAAAVDPYIIGQLTMADPLLVPLVSEYTARISELQGLRKELTDDHPRVIVVRGQTSALQAQIRAVVANAAGSMSARQAALSDKIRWYEEQLRGLPLAEQQLASLMRKSAVNAELYTFLLKKHEESRILQAAIVSNARILDPALMPRKPISPKIPLNLMLSMVLGALGGITLALLFDFVDDSIKRVEDVERQLGMSVYGMIPAIAPGNVPTLQGDESFAESFRVLRTNLVFSQDETPKKVLLFTSSVPGEGKTTVTVNLAATLAHGGYQVLLVDADLRRPQVHVRLNLPQEPGVTNFIYEKNVVTSAMGHELAPGFYAMTAGTRPANHAEFVNSAGFRKFIAEAREKFDFVLIDVPPVVAFSDAAIVSALADAVYIVVEIGKSKTQLVKRALSNLANVGAKVNGVVANKLERNSQQGSHYYYAEYYNTEARTSGGSFASRIKKRLSEFFDTE